MASLPIIPIFGNGRAKIQPIDVDDLADALIDIARLAKLPGDAIDLGGPEVLTMEDFLRRARRAIKGSEASVGHLPVGAMIAILRPLEPLLLPILPVTAGQLSGFTNDSTASPNAFFEERRSRMKGIEAMLDAYTAPLADTGA